MLRLSESVDFHFQSGGLGRTPAWEGGTVHCGGLGWLSLSLSLAASIASAAAAAAAATVGRLPTFPGASCTL